MEVEDYEISIPPELAPMFLKRMLAVVPHRKWATSTLSC